MPEIWSSSLGLRVLLRFFLAICLLSSSLAFYPTRASTDNSMTERAIHIEAENSCVDIISRISYRAPTPEEIPACLEIESTSYPPDEAATLESLTYRQSKALDYFQCAVLDDKTIIGFICSTRCEEFEEESMSTHSPSGPLLAIHSVVVQKDYRRLGIATSMLKNYIDKVQDENLDGTIRSIVLIAKAHLLGFYVNCGFQVNRPSPIVHGKDLWYDLEKSMVRGQLKGTESWFCKTESLKRPFHEVKPYLEDHKEWVRLLRQNGHCITSGELDRPGGGGLMLLAAEDYDTALKLVLQDPLVANDCVEWKLNAWIGQEGEIQLR